MGSSSVEMPTEELSAHTHSGTTSSSGGHEHTLGRGSNTSAQNVIPEYYSTSHFLLNGGTNVGKTSWTGAHTHNITISANGGNQSHENRQPYIVVYRFRRVN